MRGGGHLKRGLINIVSEITKFMNGRRNMVFDIFLNGFDFCFLRGEKS